MTRNLFTKRIGSLVFDPLLRFCTYPACGYFHIDRNLNVKSGAFFKDANGNR
ncbi:hypothetical protein QEG73_01315 [Chitinophagaceae bacterium 26-R-25]|nr:hypothetical protein [Chitinophagaceae bacterium 26-R-25]